MHIRTLTGAALALVVAGGVVALPATANASVTAPAAVSTAAAPSITVDNPDTFIPYTAVTLHGTTVPDADVYINLPSVPVVNAKVRSDADGHWEFTPQVALSFNLIGSVTVVAPGNQYADAEVRLRSAFPESVRPDAAFRPLVVSSAQRLGDSEAQVSGSATPGALVVVQAPGWKQSAAIAEADGRWTVTLGKASLRGEGAWTSTVAYQQHASGYSDTTFTIPN